MIYFYSILDIRLLSLKNTSIFFERSIIYFLLQSFIYFLPPLPTGGPMTIIVLSIRSPELSSAHRSSRISIQCKKNFILKFTSLIPCGFSAKINLL